MKKTKSPPLSSFFGVGLRHPHYEFVLEHLPSIGWFEVHSENFFMKGGPGIHFLKKIRETYPLSLHGVGLSLGSKTGLKVDHLHQLKKLIDRMDPFLVSEHLSWSRLNDIYLPDLLPVPYTEESLAVFAENIDHMQTYLGRQILIENPSTYLEYTSSTLSETDFLIELCKQTDCKLLLDINNVVVSCRNNDQDPHSYIDQIPASLVGEIHLAGHSLKKFEDGTELRIDDHSSLVSDEVWQLYKIFIEKGSIPFTLIEWDTHIPSFEVLLEEANKAERISQK